MARIVLVHGAFYGAWCWEPLVPKLESLGHVVQTLDLPGCGADATPPEDVTLASCAERVAGVLRSGEPAVLVGHSMGGVVITQAAAIARDFVERLVYVCAFLPRDGESLRDLVSLPEGANDGVQANMIIEGAAGTLPDAAAHNVLFNTCTPERAKWGSERIAPVPLAPMGTAVELDGGLDPIDRHYIIAAQDHAIPPALQRLMCHASECREIAELGTDHSPFLSATDELSALLHRAATR